jgi:hypothetical protein
MPGPGLLVGSRKSEFFCSVEDAIPLGGGTRVFVLGDGWLS